MYSIHLSSPRLRSALFPSPGVLLLPSRRALPARGLAAFDACADLSKDPHLTDEEHRLAHPRLEHELSRPPAPFGDRTAWPVRDPLAVANTTPASPRGTCLRFPRGSDPGSGASISRSRTPSLRLQSSFSSSFGLLMSIGGYPICRFTSLYCRIRLRLTM